MINHLLERRGHFRGVFNGLTDGRGLGGAEIGGLDPRLGPLRFRSAFGPTLFRAMIPRRFGRVGWFGWSGRFRCRFIIVGFHRFRFMGSKISGHFGMRLAKITGGFSLVFRVFDVVCRLGGRGVGFS